MGRAGAGVATDMVDPLLVGKKLIYSNVLQNGSNVVIFETGDYYQIVEVPKNSAPIEREVLHKAYVDKDGAIKFIEQFSGQWGVVT